MVLGSVSNMYGGGLVSSKTGVYAEIYLVRTCGGIIVNMKKCLIRYSLSIGLRA